MAAPRPRSRARRVRAARHRDTQRITTGPADRDGERSHIIPERELRTTEGRASPHPELHTRLAPFELGTGRRHPGGAPAALSFDRRWAGHHAGRKRPAPPAEAHA